MNTRSGADSEIVQQQPQLIIRLRDESESKADSSKADSKELPPAVRWSNDTIDNENLNKKKSKRCCIYHKPRAFGESDSDESDSDTEKAAQSDNPKRVKPFQRHHA
eukprot:gene10150-13653_t